MLTGPPPKFHETRDILHGWLRRLCGSGARIRLFARLPLTPYEWALAPLVVPEVEVIGDPQCVEPGGFGTFGPIEI
jgi:hypothetical protein